MSLISLLQTLYGESGQCESNCIVCVFNKKCVRIVPWHQSVQFAYDSKVDLSQAIADINKMGYKLEKHESYAKISKEV